MVSVHSSKTLTKTHGEDYFSHFHHSLDSCSFGLELRPREISYSMLACRMLSLPRSYLGSHVEETTWVYFCWDQEPAW